MKSKTLLGLQDKVTLKQLKLNYKNLMKKWHPDRCEDKEKATLISSQINKAYEIIMDYIQEYEYSLDEENIRKKTQTPQEWWDDRFKDPYTNKK